MLDKRYRSAQKKLILSSWWIREQQKEHWVYIGGNMQENCPKHSCQVTCFSSCAHPLLTAYPGWNCSKTPRIQITNEGTSSYLVGFTEDNAHDLTWNQKQVISKLAGTSTEGTGSSGWIWGVASWQEQGWEETWAQGDSIDSVTVGIQYSNHLIRAATLLPSPSQEGYIPKDQGDERIIQDGWFIIPRVLVYLMHFSPLFLLTSISQTSELHMEIL